MPNLILLFCVVSISHLCAAVSKKQHLNVWAAKISGSLEEVENTARQAGFKVLGRAGSLKNTYTLLPFNHTTVRKHRRDIETHNFLSSHPSVDWAEQQQHLKRSRRSDPLFSSQWYYGDAFPSIHAEQPWRDGITGKGVVISIVDDGLEKDNDELKDRYYKDGSYDYNSNDADPTPRYSSDNINKHGTRCAGVAGGTKDNGKCGAGVAYEASLGGIRMLDGPISDVVEGASLSHNPNQIDIYSCSWGPDDDGATFEAPGPLATEAIAQGIESGRNGLGSIYVWASGNGASKDNCNCDGYTNSIHTISISGVSEFGQIPYYAEVCSATMASTFSSGSYGSRGVVSADMHNGCTSGFTGTSAAAPMASGLLALALQSNPCLSWRDMQQIIFETASTDGLKATDWQTNGANRHISHFYGFGTIHGEDLVKAAKGHKTVPNAMVFTVNPNTQNFDVGSNSQVSEKITIHPCFADTDACMQSLEHVTVEVEFSADRRGDFVLDLKSPSGTISHLLQKRGRDSVDATNFKWNFMTVLNWGENPNGEWILTAQNAGSNKLHVKSWSVTLRGKAHPSYLKQGVLVSAQLRPSSDRKGATECPICMTGSYPDGDGGCRACSSNCTYGCFGPTDAGCMTEGALGPPASSDIDWQMVITTTLGVTLVLVLLVYGTCKFLYGNQTSAQRRHFETAGQELDSFEIDDDLDSEEEPGSEIHQYLTPRPEPAITLQRDDVTSPTSDSSLDLDQFEEKDPLMNDQTEA